MSEHCGFIVKITELHPHSNADRLQCATIFGQNVIVDLNTKLDDWGVFFPTDLQLSQEYCEYNNLVRKKDENGNNIGGYLDPEKRNVRAMKLRGERSEGLFMPLSSLEYTGVTKFEIGNQIDILNGHEICRKYIPRGHHRNPDSVKGNKGRKTKVDIAPLFAQHVDTEQLAYHLKDFKPGDLIEITLKIHGTSQRTGYLPKLVDMKPKNLLGKWGKAWGEGSNKLRNKLYNYYLDTATPVYEYGYITGTRRTVLDNFEKGGYYGGNKFREPHAKAFEGKLFKGETVYYEVAGFTETGASIMPQVANSKISDKEFTKKYGPTTTFSYGCAPDGKQMFYGRDDDGDFAIEQKVPQSRLFVYRMTMTGEDGHVVEYPPDYMRYRCEQMGIECVPVLWQGYLEQVSEDYPVGEFAKFMAEQFYDGPDPIGKTHVREGVVVRIVNKPKFCAYKHKNFNFKCLSGVAVDSLAEKDIENMDEDILSEM